jgi:hypothetical protein
VGNSFTFCLEICHFIYLLLRCDVQQGNLKKQCKGTFNPENVASFPDIVN